MLKKRRQDLDSKVELMQKLYDAGLSLEELSVLFKASTSAIGNRLKLRGNIESVRLRQSLSKQELSQRLNGLPPSLVAKAVRIFKKGQLRKSKKRGV